MVSLRRTLPPLTALTTFEAAARLRSFTKAADELGVTQAAVSRQIHALEEQLGFPVFLRLHRKIELTDKGRQLAVSASEAFNLIGKTVTELSRSDAQDELTICTTVGFSHFWLMPRISAFSRLYPHIKLRIISQDNLPDFATDVIDLAIKFGDGVWADGKAHMLFEDEIFPVCSSDYAKTISHIRTVEQLATLPLISNDTGDPTWTGWDGWLAAFGVKSPTIKTGLQCSFYSETIYAALNGHGVALGWRRMVEDLMQQNRLVRVTDAVLKTRNAYFVLVPPRRENKRCVSQFLEWLHSAANTT